MNNTSELLIDVNGFYWVPTFANLDEKRITGFLPQQNCPPTYLDGIAGLPFYIIPDISIAGLEPG